MISKRMKAKQVAFLRALADHGSVTKAAQLVGIDRTTHYEWLARDPKYQEEFEISKQMAEDAESDDLVHRARTGVFEPVVYKGQHQYVTRERTLCTLADGTTAFADELPEDATVVERRKVTTQGEMVGKYRRDPRALAKAFLILGARCGRIDPADFPAYFKEIRHKPSRRP